MLLEAFSFKGQMEKLKEVLDVKEVWLRDKDGTMKLLYKNTGG